MKGSTKCRCGCGGDVKPEITEAILVIEKELGKELTITSGYRCPEYNKKVGGVANSAHTKGLAIDIFVVDSLTRYALIQALMKHNFARIGISFKDNFVHADQDSSLPQNVLWGYV